MNGRVAGAAAAAAATQASGIALMATATWLLVTAAGQPPLHALTIAIVSVRGLAIGRGVLRYLERLVSHDAVLRMVTDVRARIFAALVDRPPLRRGDALSRMVSDVDAVQDNVIRVRLPIIAAASTGAAAVALAGFLAPLAGLALAIGLLIGGAGLPWAADQAARRSAARLAHCAPSTPSVRSTSSMAQPISLHTEPPLVLPQLRQIKPGSWLCWNDGWPGAHICWTSCPRLPPASPRWPSLPLP